MEKFKFTVDSALLSEIGEKLVEHPHIALVELVKMLMMQMHNKLPLNFSRNHRERPKSMSLTLGLA